MRFGQDFTETDGKFYAVAPPNTHLAFVIPTMCFSFLCHTVLLPIYANLLLSTAERASQEVKQGSAVLPNGTSASQRAAYGTMHSTESGSGGCDEDKSAAPTHGQLKSDSIRAQQTTDPIKDKLYQARFVLPEFKVYSSCLTDSCVLLTFLSSGSLLLWALPFECW